MEDDDSIVVNINTATEEEMVWLLPGVGVVLAQNIISARPLYHVTDLCHVCGIGPKKYAALEHLITV